MGLLFTFNIRFFDKLLSFLIQKRLQLKKCLKKRNIC